MKIKRKETCPNMDWHQVFVFWPRKTDDGYIVFFGKVWRRWKLFMSGGSYVYVAELKDNKKQ